MATVSEAWIQQSLNRLEQLEQEREQHEHALESVNDPEALRQHSEAIDRLDEEIRNLYAALEAVAEDEEQTPPVDATVTSEFQREDHVAHMSVVPPPEDEDEAASHAEEATPVAREVSPTPAVAPRRAAPVVSRREVPQPVIAQPQPVADAHDSFDDDDDDDPFGSRASMQAAVVATAEPSFQAFPEADVSSYGVDDDVPGKSSGLKWVLVAAAVLAIGGAGAFVATNSGTKAPAAQAPVGPPQVISSSPVPPDTQGPRGVVEGGNASRTPGTEYKQTNRGHSNGGGSRGANDSQPTSDPGRKIDVENTNDPLAGLK